MLIEYKGWAEINPWIIGASKGKYRSIDELRRKEANGGFPFSENCGTRLAIASWMSRDLQDRIRELEVKVERLERMNKGGS